MMFWWRRRRQILMNLVQALAKAGKRNATLKEKTTESHDS